MVDFRVGVILPAAGSGERLGGTTPKQYCRVLDKPLFLYAVEAFDKIPFVRCISLVVSNPTVVKPILQESSCGKVIVVQGDSSRHRSIKAGLLALTEYEKDLQVVVVHDAVRPIVPEDLVEQLVKAANESGAAGAVCPLISTILSTESDGSLKTALDRKSHLASETPQAFRTNILLTSYEKCSDEDLDCGTECLQLALLHSGVHARLVKGSPNDLWKVTIERDLYTASECLRVRNNSILIIALHDSNLACQLAESLSSTVRVEYWKKNNKNPLLHWSGQKYKYIVFFHTSQTNIESLLESFTCLFDIDNLGLIVHVIEQRSSGSLQEMSVHDLHSKGQTMANEYQKVKKGVVTVQQVDSQTDTRHFFRLVESLLKSHPLSMTGQTVFV